jgi:hypothetical protein
VHYKRKIYYSLRPIKYLPLLYVLKVQIEVVFKQTFVILFPIVFLESLYVTLMHKHKAIFDHFILLL